MFDENLLDGKKVTLFGEELIMELHHFNNGRIALLLVDDYGEPYTKININIPEMPLDDDEIVVKNYGENKGILEQLIAQGIVTDTGKRVQTGYVKSPVCKLVP
jgi:hypothetical protein